MLNVVAVNPGGAGDLRAWPFGQAEPFASILNYGLPGSGLNLANGVVVPLCDQATTTCTFDVSVAADGNGAQLVVDVLGYLQSTAPRVAISGSNANTFLGVNAGNFTTTTGGANTATGGQALFSNTTGVNNTATGRGALFSNTTGNANTATGVAALQSNTTGSTNTAVGFLADVSAGNLINATAIGNGAVVNASNKIRLGNSGVTVIEGQVGFTSSSDATQKEHFQPVDGERVLRKLREFVLTSWNFIGHDPTRFRHYGPSAQEFFAAFGHDGIGTIGTPTTITSTDLGGILMIAVQALERRTAEAAELKARLDAAERVAAEFQVRLDAVERLVKAHPSLTAGISGE